MKILTKYLKFIIIKKIKYNINNLMKIYNQNKVNYYIIIQKNLLTIVKLINLFLNNRKQIKQMNKIKMKQL